MPVIQESHHSITALSLEVSQPGYLQRVAVIRRFNGFRFVVLLANFSGQLCQAQLQRYRSFLVKGAITAFTMAKYDSLQKIRTVSQDTVVGLISK